MQRLVKKAYVSILILAFCFFVVINIYQATLKRRRLSDNELAHIQFNIKNRKRTVDLKHSSLAFVSVYKEPSIDSISPPKTNRPPVMTANDVTDYPVTFFETEKILSLTPMRIKNVLIKNLQRRVSTTRSKIGIELRRKHNAKNNAKNGDGRIVIPIAKTYSNSVSTVAKIQHKKDLYSIEKPTKAVTTTYGLGFSKQEKKISRIVIPIARTYSNSVSTVAKIQHKKDLYSIEKPTKAVTTTYGLGFSKQEKKKSLKGNSEVKLQKHPKTTNSNNVKMSSKVWFLRGGDVQPKPCAINVTTGERIARLYPEEDSEQDRIPNQLMFMPPKKTTRNKTELIKSIFLFSYRAWGVPFGRLEFIRQQCPVNSCSITNRIDDIETADAVIFRNDYKSNTYKRSPSQILILQLLESPEYTFHLLDFNISINWTATYRSDSTIVSPYQRWYYYDKRVAYINQNINYAQNKTRKVVWFVSHCETNNKRLQYAQELQKHIQVDIYGNCGTRSCPRSSRKCFDMLNKYYKFYLAFENSNCREYITEKFFVNGLKYVI